MKILYFSTVNWSWIKQRPHFICEYLGKKEIEITYFSVTPFLKQKIVQKRLSEYLYIKDKFVLPFAAKIRIVEKLNIIYVKSLLNKKYDIVIITHPKQYEYLPKDLKNNSKIVYECMDNIPYFYQGKIKSEVIIQEKQLCEKVDQIITSSIYLKNKIVREYKINEEKIEVIKNALDKSIEDACEASIKLKSPNLIYIGTISEWLDINILNKYAKDNPQCTIYLIGPIEKIKNDKMNDNIVFLGSIEHKDVKEYIKNGEIMLIPFKINELIKGVDPVKLYEYLALNKPVVTSYWKELNEYKENKLVYFYNTYEEFVLAIDKIKKDVNHFDEINADFVEQNNWEKRVEYYEKILNRNMLAGEKYELN